MSKHKHHIIPRHAGGTDDPSNLIELTIEEHAEAHRLLWEQYGRWQDRLAWQGLLNMIDREDAIRIAQSDGLKSYRAKETVREKYKLINDKLWSDPEHRALVSASTKKQWEDPQFRKMHVDKMGAHNDKIWGNDQIRAKIIESNKTNNRKVLSAETGYITSWSSRTKYEKKMGKKYTWLDMEISQ